jgi:hypothetical protein
MKTWLLCLAFSGCAIIPRTTCWPPDLQAKIEYDLSNDDIASAEAITDPLVPCIMNYILEREAAKGSPREGAQRTPESLRVQRNAAIYLGRHPASGCCR